MPTTYYGTNSALLNTSPPTAIPLGQHRVGLLCIREIVVLPSPAIANGDTIVLGVLPKSAKFCFGTLNASATLGGTATVAIGIAGTTGKYRTAAIFTTTDLPVFFGNNAAVNAELTADETILATIAAADLPTSGRVCIELYYTMA